MKRLLLISLCVIWLGLVLLSGYGGWLAPSRFGALPALLVLANPAFALISLVLGVCSLLFRKWLMAMVLLGGLLATWPSVNANFPIHLSHPVADSAQCFTVMSYNIAAFDYSLWEDTTQMHPIMRLILDEDADFVVMIQPVTRGLGYDERKSIEPWIDDIDRHYPYRTHSRYDGVDLLSKYPFRAVPLDLPVLSYRYFPYVIKSTNRYAFDIDLPDHKQLRIIGAYMTSFKLGNLDSISYSLPSQPLLFTKMDKAFEERERISKHLRDSLDASPANVILCTDLNDVPQSYAYRTLMSDDMRDAFRECHCGYTNTFHIHHMLFHIDHILYRGSLQAVGYKRIVSKASDHYPIVTKFVWR
jgi:endonuclease/exonuclease/phosphatase family metal-dependent hydrolase